MAYSAELIDLDLLYLGSTDDAVRVTYGDEEAAVWLPKALIEYGKIGKNIRVTLPLWLAVKKGLYEE